MPPSPENIRFHQLRKADRQGAGKLLQMFGGSTASDYTPGDVAVFDDSGDVVDGGQLPGSAAAGGFGDPYQQVPVGVMNAANADFYLDFIPLTFKNLAGQDEVWMMLQVNGVDQDPYFHFHAFPGENHFVMRFPPKASDKEMVVRYFRGIPAFTPPPPGVPNPPPPPPPPTPGGIIGCSAGTVTTLAGGGVFPYWRITVNEIRSGVGAGAATAIAELDLFSTIGGADVATGGTPFGDPGIFGANPPFAFDDNPASSWGPIASNPKLGYHFPSPVSIVSFAITNDPSINWGANSPVDLTLDWSLDGSTFTSGWRFVVDPACWTGGGQTMIFVTDSSGAPPPPPPVQTATLVIWADTAGTVNGVPAVSYSLDGGLTWVGGDGTLPGDLGMQV